MVTRKRKATVPVATRALLARVNRTLAAEGRVVKTSRGALAEGELGRYYVVDTRRNVIVDKAVDLEAFARKLGLLREYERLADE